MESAKRVISGTYGQVWLDGELVGEAYGLQAKVSMNKEDVAMCGRLAPGKKLTSTSLTGSLKLHKVGSRMAQKIATEIKAGRDPRFTLISKLADPDAYGAERIALYDVSFDDLTLADWEATVLGKTECPFTYGDFEYLDMVEAQ